MKCCDEMDCPSGRPRTCESATGAADGWRSIVPEDENNQGAQDEHDRLCDHDEDSYAASSTIAVDEGCKSSNAPSDTRDSHNRRQPHSENPQGLIRSD